jgi:hypothetical protein
MKKLVLSFIIFFAFSSISLAQIGFRAGVNLSNQTFDTSTSSSFEASGKIGFLIGVNYEIGFANTIAVRPGLEYALKGTSITFNGADANSNFDYLEIPVDFVYKTGSFSVYAGPYFAFLTSAKSGSIDVKPDHSTLDIGLNVGLGFNISAVGVGAKYGLGLSNVSDYETGNATIKNNVLSLYMTVSL